MWVGCSVGFSNCTVNPCINDDDSQAVDVYTFLVEFFAAYSEYVCVHFLAAYLIFVSANVYTCIVVPPCYLNSQSFV